MTSPQQTPLRIGRQVIAALIVITVLMVVIHLAPRDDRLARRLVAAELTRQALAQLPLPAPAPLGIAAAPLPRVVLQVSGPAELAHEVRETIASARGFATAADAPRAVWGTLQLRALARTHQLELTATLTRPGQSAATQWTGTRRWATPWSVLAPIVGIALAMATRRVLPSIFGGVLAGALAFAFTGGGDRGWVLAIASGLWRGVTHYLLFTVADPSLLYVLGFTFSLCGMVGIAGRAGGNLGIVQAITSIASNARRTRLATFLMGLAVFFDGYANAIVVGQTARPLTDAMRISREKLAYLVDSTAAPIAGLAVISTWIGWEVGLLESVSEGLGLTVRGYEMFFRGLPFRFYCLFTLVFLVVSTLLRRDFGPMLRAERRAFFDKQLWQPGSTPPSLRLTDQLKPILYAKPRWWITGLPVLLMLLATFAGMIINGAEHPALRALPFEWSWSHLQLCFAHGDNGPVLLAAALLGSVFAALLARLHNLSGAWPPWRPDRRPLMSLTGSAMAWMAGGSASVPALAILIGARALQANCDDLSTSSFLVALIGQGMPAWMLPVATFLAAASVAFGTGTSWGTMGILIPTVGPLAFHIGGIELMLVVLASILDGAVFGDHCSPISDTTIMSSLSSRCDHIDHVRTQIPYAVTVMLIAAVVGYMGVLSWLTPAQALLVGAGTIVAVLLIVGEDPETPAPSDTQRS